MRIGHSIAVLVAVCCLGGIGLAVIVGVGYRDIDLNDLLLRENTQVFNVLSRVETDVDRWITSCDAAINTRVHPMSLPIREEAADILANIESLRESELFNPTSHQPAQLRRAAVLIDTVLTLTFDEVYQDRAADSLRIVARHILSTKGREIVRTMHELRSSYELEKEILAQALEFKRERFDRMVFLFATVYIMLVLIIWTRTALTTIFPVKKLTVAAKHSLEDGVAFDPPHDGPAEIKDLSDTIGSFVNELEERVASRTVALQAQKADLERHIAERQRLERRAHNMALFALANPNPIMRLNFNGNVLMVNPAAERLFGRDQLEILGMNIRELVPGIKALAITGLVEDGFVTEQQVKFGERYFKFIFAGVPELRAIHVYGHDITETVIAEAEQRKLEAQLRRTQRLETIGTLAGGIAHDFNNILTPILGYSEIALFNIAKNKPRRDEIEQVIQAAMRAKDLVRQILTFSRQRDEERKPVLLAPIIKEALKLLRASIPRNIEICEHISPDCGSVNANASQIHQVVMNLCTNAYHAMRDSGGTLDVTLEPCKTDDETLAHYPTLTENAYLRIVVKDTGKGMDNATLERIFEPFFTTKQVGEGTGLGLSVVHGIVTGHGGAIHVESQKGQGSTFTVLLPLAEVEDDSEDGKDGDVDGGSESILFVDDEPEIASMGEEMCREFGYKTTSFTSSEAALEAFRSNPHAFDLIISDQMMPKLLGTQLIGEIHELRPDIPAILTTGFSESITNDNFRSFGVLALIMKPFVIAETARTIRQVLDEAAAERKDSVAKSA